MNTWGLLSVFQRGCLLKLARAHNKFLICFILILSFVQLPNSNIRKNMCKQLVYCSTFTIQQFNFKKIINADFLKLVLDGPKVLKILLLSIGHGCFVYYGFKVNMLVIEHIRHMKAKVHWGFFWIRGLKISFSLCLGTP